MLYIRIRRIKNFLIRIFWRIVEININSFAFIKKLFFIYTQNSFLCTSDFVYNVFLCTEAKNKRLFPYMNIEKCTHFYVNSFLYTTCFSVRIFMIVVAFLVLRFCVQPYQKYSTVLFYYTHFKTSLMYRCIHKKLNTL